MKEIFVRFDWIRYKLVFTNHSLDRMKQRWISLQDIIESIEFYDKYFDSYWKKVVEKNLNSNTIRTVFDVSIDNIILITSMILLWK